MDQGSGILLTPPAVRIVLSILHSVVLHSTGEVVLTGSLLYFNFEVELSDRLLLTFVDRPLARILADFRSGKEKRVI